jgi:hypothetical protein
MFNLLTVALFLALAPAALASTWYVDGVNGNDQNDCKSPQTACKTIGHAISLASSGDTIKVAPATYTENLTISISLKILGASAKTTIVDGGGNGTVVTIPNASANVTLSELTVENGYNKARNGYGGGINNSGALTVSKSTVSGNTVENCWENKCVSYGGGIYNSGTLTLDRSTISGNVAKGVLGDILCGGFAYGGGIGNVGTVTINNSTISGNDVSCQSCCAYGGGISTDVGTVTINNSTIRGNSASGGFSAGGGILNGGTMMISNSTFSGNRAGVNGGNISGTATIQNSILANAKHGGNCYGTMTSEGYNLSDDNTCNFKGPGDYNDTKPELGTLGYHGGPTQTIPELLGSITVDHGNPKGCRDSQGHLLKTDQRGYPRPGAHKHDKRCDMGAYERQTD